MTDKVAGRPIKRVAFIGLGMIGGSLALVLRRADRDTRISVYDPDRESTRYALAEGVVDEVLPSAVVPAGSVDIIVLSAPPCACVRWLREQPVPAGAIVTDVCSVKSGLAEAARSLPADVLTNFVPGHPIAGTENSGCVHADANMFQGCQVVLTPLMESDAGIVRRVSDLWRQAGADGIVTMSAEEHDRVFAASSHLPHMLSYALMSMLMRREDSATFMRMAGGGLSSFTRVTASSPVMWSNICSMNRDFLLAELENYQAHLRALTEQVRSGDETGLRSLFADSRRQRRRISDPR